MRRYLFICGFVSFLLLGCNDNSQRNPKREKPNFGDLVEEDANSDPMLDGKFDDAGGEVRFGSLTLTAPPGWPRKQPKSNKIQAEYALPKAEGDKRDGRLTLSLAGGSIEDNIERWKGQFGGNPEKSKQEEMKVSGISVTLSVTLVDFSGDFNDGMGGSGVEQPGYRMIAAIVPVGKQLHFVKAYGPEKTMEAQAEKIKAFIRSAKK